jgi:hypothetical protein
MEAAEALSTVKAGDVVEVTRLFPGVSKDKVGWRVIEVVEKGDKRRLTLHAYHLDIFLGSFVVLMEGGKVVGRGASKHD